MSSSNTPEPAGERGAAGKRATSDTVSNAQPLRDLWIFPGRAGDGGTRLSLHEWLAVVDESVSLGVRTVVLSIDGSLSACPDAISIADWAQSSYGLTVAFHLKGHDGSASDLLPLRSLHETHTVLIANSKDIDKLALVDAWGIRRVPADGLGLGGCGDQCTLSSGLCCVGSDGELYTCGSVVGMPRYGLGHSLTRKLKEVFADAATPRSVHVDGASGAKGCEGCPPRLSQIIRQRD